MVVVIVTLFDPSKFVLPVASPPRLIVLVFSNCEAVLVFAVIVLDTTRLVRVPTAVKLDETTLDASVAPVRFPASVVPAAPVAPVAPVGPVGPVAPVGPVGPAAPVVPV
jgi:hypothetical protein